MPSAPLASKDCPLDLDHLRRMTSGDKELEREVLEMFLKQTSRLVAALADRPAEAGTLLHTLKGSARAIGAFRVADAADAMEEAARQGHDTTPALATLTEAAAEARAAIERLLSRP